MPATPTRHRPPLRRRRVQTLLISLAATLLLAELGLRIYARIAHHERGLLWDAELGWRLAPNLVKVGEYWGAEVPARTNSLGWRDDEFMPERRAGVQRVAVLGDSFAFGVGVDHGQRFTELLERDGVEVLNFGVNAFGTDQELRLLETEVMAFEPDIVVLTVFLGNDLEDIRHEERFGWSRPHFELSEGELHLIRPELTWAIWVRTSSYLGELLMRPFGSWLEEPRVATAWESADVVPLFATLIARMAALVEVQHAHFLVLLLYPEGWLEDELPEQERRARKAVLNSPLEVLDLRSTLARAERDLYLPDGHLAPQGHALVAETLRDTLLELGWLR